MSIAIIPARSGSTRIKNKNIRAFHGKPILAYSIETAIRTGLFDRIIVSTNSEDIADVALEYGACPVWRGDTMSQNDIGTQQVVQFVIKQLDVKSNFVCCLYATAPLMKSFDISDGLKVLVEDEKANYAFSVGTEPLQDAGQFYWGRRTAFETGLSLIGPRSRMIPIESERVCDINTEDDWLRAERMYADLHNNETEIRAGGVTWVGNIYTEPKECPSILSKIKL